MEVELEIKYVSIGLYVNMLERDVTVKYVEFSIVFYIVLCGFLFGPNIIECCFVDVN